ncbi:hypothetical protein [Terribacillus saccharophilus]|uniref:hypothetical protein n=1 Tax=Terribacillus saccharophilus TaxID=361277 RepID=UPI002989F668|nr:hypothetical protein [Terribacillus saccharophilus]MCM3226000.1 hypothetical protein [Terribacillus saccharophilus]
MRRIGSLFLLIVIMTGCSNDPFQDHVFSNELSYPFITTLVHEDGKAMLTVFEEDKGINEAFSFEIGDLKERNYSATYVDQKRNVTAINEMGTVNYDVFTTDNKAVNYLGSLKEPVDKIAQWKDYIYIVTYKNNKDGTREALLKKYNNDDLKTAEEEWPINGKVEDLKIDPETGNVHFILRSDQTELITLVDDELKNIKIFDEPVSSRLMIHEGEIFMSKYKTVHEENKSSSNTIEQAYNEVVQIKDNGAEKLVTTTESPTSMIISGQFLYVITGDPNQAFLEIFDRNTAKLIQKDELEGGMVNGLSESNGEVYIYTNNIVYQVLDDHRLEIAYKHKEYKSLLDNELNGG